MTASFSRRTALRAALAGGAGVTLGVGALGAPAAMADHVDLADLTDLEHGEPDRLLTVIGKDNAIEPLDYEPDDLVIFGDTEYELREEVAEQLEKMFEAAADDDIELRLISGYRSFETQEETYDYWVQRYGRRAAERSSARPGHSEHQSGLAVDLDDASGDCYLDRCFGDSDAGVWLQDNAYRFGFIKSYPQGGEDRTGFMYEPWHWRYVGPRASGRMHQLDIEFLEDYTDPERALAGLGLWIGNMGDTH